MSDLILCLGWAAVLTCGLWLAWVIVRFVLPWLAMLAIVGVLAWCMIAWNSAHVRATWAAICGKACRETGSLAPKLGPIPRKSRKPGTAPVASIEYCTAHPNAEICEDRD